MIAFGLDTRRAVMRRRCLLALAVLLGTLGVAPSDSPAAGAPKWGPVQFLGRNSVYAPVVRVTARGESVAVWLEYDINNHRNAVMASTASPGRRFTGRRALSAWTAGEISAPQIALDRSGTAMVVWAQTDGGVRVAIRHARTSFGPTQTVSSEGVAADVALDHQGNAVVAWLSGKGSAQRVEASYRPSRHGFGAPQVLSAPAANGLFSPRAIFDVRGRALVGWTAWDAERRDTVQVATRPSGRPFGAPATLSRSRPDSTFNDLELMASPTGEVVATWSHLAHVGMYAFASRIEVSVRPPQGSFRPATAVSESGAGASGPQLAVSPAGVVTVVWGRSSADRFGEDGVPTDVRAVDRPPHGRFGRARTISGRRAADPPAVAVDASGNELVAFRASSPASTFRPGNAVEFQPPVRLALGNVTTVGVSLGGRGIGVIYGASHADNPRPDRLRVSIGTLRAAR